MGCKQGFPVTGRGVYSHVKLLDIQLGQTGKLVKLFRSIYYEHCELGPQ